MSFMLQLSTGENLGKDTGMESVLSDAIYATFLLFGQPTVFHAMIARNALRNEGLTNRFLAFYLVRGRLGIAHSSPAPPLLLSRSLPCSQLISSRFHPRLHPRLNYELRARSSDTLELLNGKLLD